MDPGFPSLPEPHGGWYCWILLMIVALIVAQVMFQRMK